MADLVIKNGKIVNPSEVISAGIAVDKGKLAAICSENYLPYADRTIDAAGKYILPGVIDNHWHLGSFHPEAFGEEARTETIAAAVGGTTTIGHYIIEPIKGVLATLDRYKRDFEANAVCDGFFHAMMLNPEMIKEIPKLPEFGINSFKYLPGYKGPHAEFLGIKEPTDNGVIYLGFCEISKLGRPAWGMVHAEDADIIMKLRSIVEATGRQDPSAWRDSRPNFVEATSMRTMIELAAAAKCPLFIVHITTAEGIDILAEAKAKGLDVKGEACIRYLTHNCDEPIQMWLDNPALTVVNPPFRDKKSNKRLWEGIRDGIIDVIGTDSGVGPLETQGNDVWNSPMGTGGTEFEMLLRVMLSEGVNKGRISLKKVAEVCCYNPARIFGLFPQKGKIAVGSDADLVMVDMAKKVKITPELHLSATGPRSIWDGWDFMGWPVLTILRGQVVAEDGKFVAKPGIGRYLACKVESSHSLRQLEK